MRSSTQLARLPYAVIGEHHFRGGGKETWVLCRRATLASARDYAWALTYAWLRLIGGQASPLVWYVLDERTNTPYRTLRASTEEDQHGDQTDHPGRLF